MSVVLRRRRRRRGRRSAGLAAVAALALTGCSTSSGGAGSTSPAASAASPTAYRCSGATTVTVATHDSFNLPDALLQDFTAKTGCTVTVLESGDAGALTNKLVLTKNAPIADAVFGIDNTFAGRAVKEGVLADYTPQLPPGASAHAAPGSRALTPVDYGDVCVNVDTTWFAARSKPAPATLDDLTKPEYRSLFVTPAATTSSPGLAFLLATVAAYGKDGWQDYWRKLLANDPKITSGWTDAYSVDFTAGEGKGTRPLVLSYASSPPFTIPEGGTTPMTAALLDTCYRQVEYAGVLSGAKNPDGAKAFVDFLLTKPVQEAIPEEMYMFPVSGEAVLPPEWAAWAKVAPKPYTLPQEDIEAGREQWLRTWNDLTTR